MEAVNEFLAPLKRRLEKEAIKYGVQKQMFCAVTGDVLDYRTCIAIEVNDSTGKLISYSVVSPKLDAKLDLVPGNIQKLFPDSTVIFKTLNKHLVHPLLTKI